jgi:hypothetical protein
VAVFIVGFGGQLDGGVRAVSKRCKRRQWSSVLGGLGHGEAKLDGAKCCGGYVQGVVPFYRAREARRRPVGRRESG